MSFGGAPVDISGYTYQSKSMAVGSEESQPLGFVMGDSGSKAYIIGDTDETVYQYNLTTPYDISTGSYASKSFLASAQVAEGSGLAFSADGTKMYIVSSIDQMIYQYTLSTAWDVSTASYASKSFDPDAQTTGAQGMFMKADGTKMWIIDAASDDVFQYTMSTPFDISTSSYDSKLLDFNSEETNGRGIFITSNGLTAFIVGLTNDTVFQYDLTTPFDISTASYSGNSFDVSGEDTAPMGLFATTDALVFFVLGIANTEVFQYS